MAYRYLLFVLYPQIDASLYYLLLSCCCFSTRCIRNKIKYIDEATYEDKNSFKAVGNTTFCIWLDNLPYLITFMFLYGVPKNNQARIPGTSRP